MQMGVTPVCIAKRIGLWRLDLTTGLYIRAARRHLFFCFFATRTQDRDEKYAAQKTGKQLPSHSCSPLYKQRHQKPLTRSISQSASMLPTP
jgi:hypothetical protein